MNQQEKQKVFLDLILPVRQKLEKYASAMARNREDARDLVSETILIAYQNFESIKKRESFMYYLFTIASRLHRRRQWKKRIFSSLEIEKTENFPSNGHSPDNGVEMHLLYAALDKLPEKQREAIVLFELSGFSIEEIKDVQGGTISGVKSRLKRGREQLNVLLSDEYSPQSKPGKKIKNTNGTSSNSNLDQYKILETNSAYTLKVTNE
jgi:RNA polymerase sigma-70 factor (ECF subfamily)